MQINLPITSDGISVIAVVLTVVTFVLIPVICKARDKTIALHDLIVRALAASSLPTAIVIVLCAIDLSLLTKLGGLLQVYIALAGLSLAYVSSVALFSPLTSKKPKGGSDAGS